ncbi:MAG: hypothetical protein IPM24_18205 [Bryobacterales bacterium]|nr:hypothetical protein [Bryobacterales bacterium]
MDRREPFVFFTEQRLVVITGRHASDLGELLEGLREVSGSSIFYHFHQRYLSHHFEKPPFRSAFADWVARALLEERLAEKLTGIDLFSMRSVRQVREATAEAIERYLAEVNGRLRKCPEGDEFHFCESKSFVVPLGLTAHNVRELAGLLPRVTNASLFYHFFESRLRLERTHSDFSEWIAYRGAPELAAAIDRLDPYLFSLDKLKAEICRLADTWLTEAGGDV